MKPQAIAAAVANKIRERKKRRKPLKCFIDHSASETLLTFLGGFGSLWSY